MTDVGKLVTDDEVIAFVESIKHIDTKESLIIQAVEDVVRAKLGIEVDQQSITDEEHDIELETRCGGLVLKRKNKIFLKRPPVITFNELKIVNSRGNDGSPSSTTTIDRSRYHVNLQNGVLTLIDTVLSEQASLVDITTYNSSLSFPDGVARILASYTGGYSSANIPPTTKMTILMIIARIYKLAERGVFHVSSVESEIGTTTFNRVKLTPEEELMLGSSNIVKRPALG